MYQAFPKALSLLFPSAPSSLTQHTSTAPSFIYYIYVSLLPHQEPQFSKTQEMIEYLKTIYLLHPTLYTQWSHITILILSPPIQLLRTVFKNLYMLSPLSPITVILTVSDHTAITYHSLSLLPSIFYIYQQSLYWCLSSHLDSLKLFLQQTPQEGYMETLFSEFL